MAAAYECRNGSSGPDNVAARDARSARRALAKSVPIAIRPTGSACERRCRSRHSFDPPRRELHPDATIPGEDLFCCAHSLRRAPDDRERFGNDLAKALSRTPAVSAIADFTCAISPPSGRRRVVISEKLHRDDPFPERLSKSRVSIEATAIVFSGGWRRCGGDRVQFQISLASNPRNSHRLRQLCES